MKSIIWTGE